MLDVSKVRQDFPILDRQVHNKPLVYLDNAATMQRPKQVVAAINDFYLEHNANVHRGVHTLSDEATDAFESARRRLADWINASPETCIFTRGTTEAINLVAYSFFEPMLSPGDEILLSHMEHHANIVPWQLLCDRTGAVIRVIPVTEQGDLEFDAFESMLNDKTKLVGVSYISNVLGTINPIKAICDKAHAVGAFVVVDGAQALAHTLIDVGDLDCDFLALSAHKAFGPTGIGALYGKIEHLQKMRPYQGGGEMIHWVSFDKTEYKDPPYRFEAGTPNIAGAIGWKAALDYMAQLGMEHIKTYEATLWQYVQTKLCDLSELIRPLGMSEDKIAILSFSIAGVHANDLGIMLDTHGIAIRTGHHCAMPLMARFGETATARASFAVYNTFSEIDYFFQKLIEIVGVLKL